MSHYDLEEEHAMIIMSQLRINDILIVFYMETFKKAPVFDRRLPAVASSCTIIVINRLFPSII